MTYDNDNVSLTIKESCVGKYETVIFINPLKPRALSDQLLQSLKYFDGSLVGQHNSLGTQIS